MSLRDLVRDDELPGRTHVERVGDRVLRPFRSDDAATRARLDLTLRAHARHVRKPGAQRKFVASVRP